MVRGKVGRLVERVAVALLALLILGGMPLGCARNGGASGGGEGSEEGVDLSDTTVWVKERGIVLSPTSRVLLSLLDRYGVPFDSDLVPVEFPLRVTKSTAREAVMLGMYSVDALYFIYGDNKDAVQRCFFRLGMSADALGLSEELQLQELALACSYATDVESLIPLIGQRLVRLGKALRLRGHEDYYALIASGTWVESTRILSHIALQSGREELYRLVAEQRFLLSEVGELLSGYVYDLPEAEEVYNQLSAVNGVYGGVQIGYSYQTVEVDTANHFSKINATMQFAMSKAQLQAIAGSLEAARTVMLGE